MPRHSMGFARLSLRLDSVLGFWTGPTSLRFQAFKPLGCVHDLASLALIGYNQDAYW